jgi:hypothetical protein
VESGADERSRESERLEGLSLGEPGGDELADVDCGNREEVALSGRRLDVGSISIIELFAN